MLYGTLGQSFRLLGELRTRLECWIGFGLTARKDNESVTVSISVSVSVSIGLTLCVMRVALYCVCGLVFDVGWGAFGSFGCSVRFLKQLCGSDL